MQSNLTQPKPSLNPFIQDCAFPYVNVGYNDLSKWVEGDCSLTYSEAVAEIEGWNQYDIKCVVYIIPQVLGMMICLNYYFISRGNRVARGKDSPMSIGEKGLLGFLVMQTSMAINLIDMDCTADRLSIFMSNLTMGFGLTSMMYTTFTFVEKWVMIIEAKGKSQVCPPWLKKLKHVSVIIIFVGEIIVANVEQVVGGGGMASEVNSAYDAKINSFKNLICGFVVGLWGVIAVNYGTSIKKKLATAGNKETSATKKIGEYCKGIGICSILGCGYKFLFCALRIGKTIIYTDPPCGGGWISPLPILMIVVSFVAVASQKPNKSNAKVGNNNSNVSSTKAASSSSSSTE